MLYLWWWGVLVVSASLISTTGNAYDNGNFTCQAGYVKGQLTTTDYSNITNNLGNTTPLVGTTALAIRLTANGGNGEATITPQTIGGVSVFNVNFDLTSRNLTNNINIEFFNKLTSQPLDISNLHISLYDIDTGADTGVGYDWVDKVWIRGNNATLNPAAPNKPTTINGATPEFWGSTNGINSPLTCLDNSLDERCQLPLQFNTTVNNVNIQYGNKPYGLPMLFLFAKGNPEPQNFALRIDGYCYRPHPLIQVNKTFPNGRFAEQDQFNIPLTQNNTTYTGFNTVTNSLSSVELSTTTTANNYSSNVYLIQPDLPYQLSETIVDTNPNDTYIPNLAYYQPTLSCTNNDTPMTIVLGQSFTPTYSDNLVCTLTNSQKIATITAINFADVGTGTTNALATTTNLAEREQIIDTRLNDLTYFNGLQDNSAIETGIAGGNIQLYVDCNDKTNSEIVTTTNTTNANGAVVFQLPANQAIQLQNSTNACLVQSNDQKAVDSSSNTFYLHSQIDTTASDYKYNPYRGEFDFVNNNLSLTFPVFGDVDTTYAPLILTKAQAVNTCLTDTQQLTTLSYIETITSAEGTPTNPLGEPNQCVAYKITTINSGHVPLTNIVINDTLQQQGVNNAVVTATLYTNPTGIAIDNATSVPLNQTGSVITQAFDLPVKNANGDHIQTLYFNTQYGSSVTP